MSYIMVDIEADGPIPGDYSMVCLGAVVVEPKLERTFYGQLKPLSDRWIERALAVSGFSREETLAFDEPDAVMARFRDWLSGVSEGQPLFISDNNGFDWQFVNWYFHHFLDSKPLRLQLDQPRLALQGRGARHVQEFQTLEKDAPHPPSRRRRKRKRGGASRDPR